MTGYPLQNRYEVYPEKIIALVLEIKEIKDRGKIDMPEAEIRQSVEEYLQAHNTCTLCTSRLGHVRGTPIEYFYKDACLYMCTCSAKAARNLQICC